MDVRVLVLRLLRCSSRLNVERTFGSAASEDMRMDATHPWNVRPTDDLRHAQSEKPVRCTMADNRFS